MLDCAYIMQIVNIHKQAELSKNNGLDSFIVYRREYSSDKDMQYLKISLQIYIELTVNFPQN